LIVEAAFLTNMSTLVVNIAYLSASKIPSRKANSVHVMKMCSAMSQWGADITLFAEKGGTERGNTFEQYGLDECFNINYTQWPNLRVLGSLTYSVLMSAKLYQLRDFDLIYSRHRYALLFALIHNIPFVYEIHSMPKNVIEHQTEKLLFQSVAFRKLVVVSAQLREDFLSGFRDLVPSDVVVAHDAADRPKTRQSINSNSWPGRKSTLQVGYVGHLYPGKGMKVISSLAPMMPEIDFHIIGGADKDIQKWKQKASCENLYYHGFVPHGRLSLYYNSLNVGLCPIQDTVVTGGKDISRWTSPLKIFEYMSHGLPVLCSDLPVLREVIKNRKNGLVAKRDSIQDWKKKLTELRRDDELRDKLSKKAKKIHEKRFTWEHRARRVLSKIKFPN